MAQAIASRRHARARDLRPRRHAPGPRPDRRRHTRRPGLWTLVTGVKYGFSATPETLAYARGLLPAGALWSAFGIGRAEFPVVAQAWLLGGHVRVGLEDNIYLEKGVLAPGNASLVTNARRIVEDLGGALMNPREARDRLGLPARR